MNKKYLIAILINLSLVSVLKAEHRFGINASNITLGTLPNERLNPSSVTLQGNSFSIAGATANLDGRVIGLEMFRSTAQPRFESIGTSTTTITSRADKVAIETTTFRGEINALHTTTATILTGGATAYIREVGTQTLRGGMTFQGNVTANRYFGDGSALSGLTTQISIFDEGVFQGNVSSMNFTGAGVSASVSGGTATITIAGGGGSTNPRTYSLAICSFTGCGGDFEGSNETPFNNAISSLSNSGGTIFVRKGNYTVGTITVTANVEMIFESSAILKNKNDQVLLNLSGTVRNLQFHFSSLTNKNAIVFNTGARLFNTKVLSVKHGNFTEEGLFTFRNSSNVIVDGFEIHRWDAANNSFLVGKFLFNNSQFITINNYNDFGSSNTAVHNGDGLSVFSFIGSNNRSITIRNTNIKTVGIVVLTYLTSANNSFVFENSYIFVENFGTSSALFRFMDEISTGTVIRNVTVNWGEQIGQLDRIFSWSAGQKNRVQISNFYASPLPEVNTTILNFINCEVSPGGSQNIVYNTQVHNISTFLNGSCGVKRGANNYLNGVRQTDDN